MSHLSTRVVPAYAKLNLSLSVVGRRSDGFHDIDSVLVPIDWHDLVGVSVALAATPGVSLKVTGPAADGVPTDDSNLTVRAAGTLRGLAGRPLDVRLWLHKSVPHGAGLGGGSADAAAVLRAGTAALEGLGIPIHQAQLETAALGIGSDVPALLDLHAHRVRGRGHRLERLTIPSLHLVVTSTVPSSTAATYQALLPSELVDDGRTAALVELLTAGLGPDPGLLGSALEPAACRADRAVEAALHRARSTLPEIEWHLTGSGGAVFALTSGRAVAERIAAAMQSAGFSARACRTMG